MNAVAQLMDLAKARKGIETDMALAERLGRSRQTTSHWRNGVKCPEDDQVMELAKLAAEDPAPWLVAVQAQRSTGSAAATWAALARKLGAAAAVLLYIGAMTPSPAAAQTLVFEGNSPGLYIMSSLRRFASWLRRSLTLPAALPA